jgi:hypothetical protein
MYPETEDEEPGGCSDGLDSDMTMPSIAPMSRIAAIRSSAGSRRGRRPPA